MSSGAALDAAGGPDTPLAALAALRCRAGAPRLTAAEIAVDVAALPGWTCDGRGIEKTFAFTDWRETIAFVNALAWIAQREGHHPDLAVHYARCVVRFSTHDAGGVTRNDVVCAAKVERLFA